MIGSLILFILFGVILNFSIWILFASKIVAKIKQKPIAGRITKQLIKNIVIYPIVLAISFVLLMAIFDISSLHEAESQKLALQNQSRESHMDFLSDMSLSIDYYGGTLAVACFMGAVYSLVTSWLIFYKPFIRMTSKAGVGLLTILIGSGLLFFLRSPIFNLMNSLFGNP